MSYDKQYYDNRKEELERDFQREKDRAFNNILRIVNEWGQESNRLRKKFGDLEKKKKESKKKSKKKTKKKKK